MDQSQSTLNAARRVLEDMGRSLERYEANPQAVDRFIMERREQLSVLVDLYNLAADGVQELPGDPWTGSIPETPTKDPIDQLANDIAQTAMTAPSKSLARLLKSKIRADTANRYAKASAIVLRMPFCTDPIMRTRILDMSFRLLNHAIKAELNGIKNRKNVDPSTR